MCEPCWWCSIPFTLVFASPQRLTGWPTKRALVSTMTILFILRVLSLLRTWRWPKTKARREKVPTMHSANTSPSKSSPDSPAPSITVLHERQDYCELAQRLHPLLPAACNRLESEDVLIIDKSPFSSGSFSEVWQGSLQGLLVAVKSLRLYASPEFDPAEVGIVSAYPSARLKQC